MLKEQFTSIDWGDIDVLVVDLPPSTSDSAQAVLEICGNATVVPVTINTALAISDTRRSTMGISFPFIATLLAIIDCLRFITSES
jgi:Mrp family chromosome partitioning ATPase